MKLIIGLGNPDKSYGRNRHNIGFICLDAFARRHSIPMSHRRSHSRTGEGTVGGEDVVLAKPQTYMNLSGEAVAALCSRHRARPADILVVHDDMDLPLGRMRLRAGGSSGGHKGIQSIIERLGTRDFARLKLGIGRPDRVVGEGAIVDYVLGDFTSAERGLMEPVLAHAAEAIERFVAAGIESVMNEFNRPATASAARDAAGKEARG